MCSKPFVISTTYRIQHRYRERSYERPHPLHSPNVDHGHHIISTSLVLAYKIRNAPAIAMNSPALDAPAASTLYAADFVIVADAELALADPVEELEVVGLSWTTPPLMLSGFLTSAFFASSRYFDSVWSDPDLFEKALLVP
jgi:hypothetical protein